MRLKLCSFPLLVVSLLVPAIVNAVPSDPINAAAAEKAQRERRIAPLKAAGVNIESVDELLKALDTGEIPQRIAASYVLGEKKAAAAIPALMKTVAAQASHPLLKLEACDALRLIEQASSNWMNACQPLMAPPNDAPIRIRAAGILAKAGNTAGWDLVLASLQSANDKEVEEAALVAPFFDGLSHNQSKIQVFQLAAAAFRTAARGPQTSLIAVLWKTAKPEDTSTLSSLIGLAKDPYLNDYLKALVRQKTGK